MVQKFFSEGGVHFFVNVKICIIIVVGVCVYVFLLNVFEHFFFHLTLLAALAYFLIIPY